MTPFQALLTVRARQARAAAAQANAIASQDADAMADAILAATALADTERIMLDAWRREVSGPVRVAHR